MTETVIVGGEGTLLNNIYEVQVTTETIMIREVGEEGWTTFQRQNLPEAIENMEQIAEAIELFAYYFGVE